MANMNELEPFVKQCGPEALLLDYCLWPYTPLTATDGKQHSFNLLLNSFEAADVGVNGVKLINEIQEVMGEGRTVWGVKLADGKVSWELYFYDYERLERKNSFTRLKQLMPDSLSTVLDISEDVPYFMFSIDLDVDGLNTGCLNLSEANVYIGNDGSNVSSGICYELSEEGLSLSNLYYFYNSVKEKEDILAKIASSVHLNLRKLDFNKILLPELRDCETTVVANKKQNEGIYFSRIKIEQLIWFLKAVGYPELIQSYVMASRNELDHMLYDVGIDYKMLPDGQIEVLKTSYYGIF
ncbi:hypothetical protein ACMXYX_02210 [Neptuniibacter sp. QD72_48]|uniref:hypothetical protein n=1 Tax=unclassified Neptuniibacter TaxID=2630693 RepID=UPI0039F52852